jgi:hypothetical protein
LSRPIAYRCIGLCTVLVLLAGAGEKTLGSWAGQMAQTAAVSIPYRPSLSPPGGNVVHVQTVADGVVRRVNAPHFDGEVRYPETAVFWFGRVNNTDNYADVRVGYNAEHLAIHVAAFDRYLWYDPEPDSKLEEWDAATLYLDLARGVGDGLTGERYRFVAQINAWEDRPAYQRCDRGDDGAWSPVSLPFSTESGWRGEDLNKNGSEHDDRGWALTFYVPFSSLGLAAPPAEGTVWGLAVALHDRDNASALPAIADQYWPEGVSIAQPSAWGELRFGVPTFTPQPAVAQETVTIRQGLAGANVPDAAVGGYSVCGGGLDYWTEWGDANETYYHIDATDFNIQNQSDVSDWPCFSKYYVTFPLDALPSDRVILSATLTLHQFGGSGGPGDAEPSLIQVLTVAEDWEETTLTWNNAPLAVENVSAGWVDPLDAFPGWPGVPWEWDLTRAVAEAYAAGGALRLVLYEADAAYHSGKYFVSSDTGDWNDVARPTLRVTWGEPIAMLNQDVYLPFLTR